MTRFGCWLLVACAGAACTSMVAAQRVTKQVANDAADAPWTILKEHAEATLAGESWVRPDEYQAISLDTTAMRNRLAAAPLERTPDYRGKAIVLELPTPTGEYKFFSVWEAPVMEAALQAQHPEIRTYVGQGLSNPAETLRMDMTPAGFHAQVLGPDGDWYIDPVTRHDVNNYASYFKRGLGQARPFQCLTEDAGNEEEVAHGNPGPVFLGGSLREYRLAITTTGEYSAYHGGTVPLVLAAVTTAVNRVTGVYERDLGVRLNLVAGSTAVFFLNAATDPYTSPGANTTTLNAEQAQFDTFVGAANYDVGHLFHRGANNGVAGSIGNVCVVGNKGRGISVVEPPVGDPFSIDYVAHELGHQFGGRHSFNSCGGGPGDAAAIAHEPGSGSTIMGYAGICGTDDLQPNSDAMFASINIFDQIVPYISTGSGSTCDVLTATGNADPVVNAGPDYTIPSRTPFELKITSSSDPNGDALTYSWEQRNGGTADPLPLADLGDNPIARVWPATTTSSRVVPRLSNLLNNTLPVGEVLPTTSRTMAWRCVVRDNRAGGGGAGFDDMNLTTVSTAGPFSITSPASATTWSGGSSQTITWNVASTNAAPINCANVKVLFSSDGGNTWPTTILASTPNDGSQAITVPNIATTQGRIRVEAVGNIFFNINQGGLITVSAPAPGIDVVSGGTQVITDNTGNGNSNGRIDSGESAIQVFVPLINNGLTTATGVVGTLTSLTPTVTVTTASAPYNNLVGQGASQVNTSGYVINVSNSHVCGAPINLRLNVATNQGTPAPINFTLSSGTPGGPGTPVRYQYAGASVAIPDNNATGGSAILNISGVANPIADVNFSFDGTSCNATAGSLTNGLTHSYLGDTVISLISPAGTSVTLSNRRGVGGNNMCNTVFDDSAATSITTIVASGAPWSGTYRPEGLLSSFNGQNANGNWTCRVVDQAATDTGFINRFSVYITPQLTPVCEPPLPTGCDGIDFNNDGSIFDPLDIDAFLSVFGEGPCIPANATCNDIDFNNDGSLFDPMDIDAFLSVFSEGPCIR
ncbi:MAG: M12 family metallo-peptidase [Phycisphaerales bacterium]